LSSQLSHVFAGFAPVSGTNPRDFYEDLPVDADFSMLWIHGTRDPVVPADGTEGKWGDHFLYETPQADAARVAASFGCAAQAVVAADVAALANAPDKAALVCMEHTNCMPTDQGSPRRVA
jgi:poly(3-hydroxybutyrate) depolymerase